MVADISSSESASRPSSDSLPPLSGPEPVGLSMARSSPAEKLCPEPLTRTTRTSSGISRPIAASARHIVGVWALRTSGRCRVIVATAPSTSYRSPAASSSSGVMAGV